MKSNNTITVIEGIKFSFTVPRAKSPEIIASAVENDLEVSYKGFGNNGTHTLIKGIGRAENVVSLLETIAEVLPEKTEKLDFMQSFKYKVSQFAEPCFLPFVAVVENQISNPKKS